MFVPCSNLTQVEEIWKECCFPRVTKHQRASGSLLLVLNSEMYINAKFILLIYLGGAHTHGARALKPMVHFPNQTAAVIWGHNLGLSGSSKDPLGGWSLEIEPASCNVGQCGHLFR